MQQLILLHFLSRFVFFTVIRPRLKLFKRNFLIMGKTTRILALFLCLGLFTAMVETVTMNAISINGSSGSFTGNFSFNIQTAVPNTHVFTLFGDGTFSCLRGPNVLHNYESSSTGYTARSFYVKPYEPNPPPEESVNTGSVNANGGANTPISMSGEIDILTSWAPSSGNENYYIIAFRNTTSTSPIDGSIELHYNNNDISINFADILEYNYVYNRNSATILSSGYNQKLKWEFSNLNFGETRFVYVPATVALRAFDNLNLHANLKINGQGGFGDDDGQSKGVNSNFLVLRYPHDPNFKIVNRKEVNYYQEFQQLEYTVGFFNDGENFADDVFLSDKLSEQLNPGTLTITDSEYPYYYSLSGTTAHIDYWGIMLPGINQDSPENYSYQDAFSYLKFQICTELDPIFKNCIENAVDIEFTGQPILTTNRAISCKVEQGSYTPCAPIFIPPPMFRATAENAIEMLVTPNPFSNLLTIEINKPTKKLSLIHVDLLDVSGKEVQQLYKTNAGNVNVVEAFDLSTLPSGMYFIRLKTENEILTEKVIKF